MEERIGFGIYQSCVYRVCVGRVSLFGLRWCVWCNWEVCREFRLGSGGVWWCYICVSCESRFFV